MITFILGLLVGGTVGFFTAALLASSGRDRSSDDNFTVG